MPGQLGAKPVVKPGTNPAPATTPATKRTKVTTPSTPGGAPASFGGQKLDPNDPKNANLFKAINKATGKPPIQEAIPTVNPGQLAARSTQRNTPVNPAPAANTMANAPVSKVNVAKPTNPNQQAATPASQPAPAAPAAVAKPNPNEKQLFTQLVRAAALSNTAAATGEKSANQAGADTSKKQIQDPQQMIGDVQAAVKPVVDPNKLSAAGQALRQHFQIDSTVSSTGDDAVDALLLAMGFHI
jgi:hypothetical protein